MKLSQKIREYCLDLYEKRVVVPLYDDPSRWNRHFLEGAASEEIAEALQALNQRRAKSIAAFLQSHDIPSAADEVLDIGCGSGGITCELAKTAKHVTGADISELLLKASAKTIQRNKLTNVDLVSCDIRSLDPEQAGWLKKFDLVFAAMTPPCYDLNVIRKMEAMSRKFCFLDMELTNIDYPGKELIDQVFGMNTLHSHNRTMIFQLLNTILCTEGYLPSVRYYKDICPVNYRDEEAYLQRLLDITFTTSKTEQQIEQLRTLLRQKKDENGVIQSRRELLTGRILWDVRKDEGMLS